MTLYLDFKVTISLMSNNSKTVQDRDNRDPGVLTKAFVVYVRPIVEYCSPVWSPCTVLNINNIESVQRTFTKRLSGMRSLSYNGRLSLLGLEQFELRRIRADLTMCFKIVHQFVDIPFDKPGFQDI